jgi:hypothetical protein
MCKLRLRKVVELLTPHQSQGAMLVPRPLEPRGRPTALTTPPAYAENLAMLRTHILVRPSRLDIHVSATPFSATLAAAPRGNWCCL